MTKTFGMSNHLLITWKTFTPHTKYAKIFNAKLFKKLLISWWLCKDCSASGNSLFETIATISRHCLFRIQHHSFVFPTKGRHVSRCAECIVSEITTFSGFCDPRGKKSFGVNGGVNCNLRPFDFKLLSRV